MIAFLFLVILLLIAIIVWLLVRTSATTVTPVEPPPGPPAGPAAPSIPDRLGPGALATALRARLAGTPADGSARAGGTPSQVVWVDRGDELLVHLDGTTTRIVGDTVLVSIDLECDQTGRTPLVVAFALGASEEAGLVAATDAYPRGNGLLASRWGGAVQAAAWSALLALANDHATERGLAPLALTIQEGNLHLIAGEALKLA